ncbi:hypothetical protein M885DRAFT_619438 [Pelagophyceae sp. CCMP2097]|nr:hypothetical protein M885DRAFT_619438 [Pelagophyceae sp. CCMP2097]
MGAAVSCTAASLAASEDLQVGVSARCEQFYQQVIGFVSAKSRLDAVAATCLPEQFMRQHVSFKKETPLCQKQGDAETLYAAANETANVFADTVSQMCVENGEVKLAPLKSLVRSSEKVELEYHGDWRRLVDVSRASIIVQSEAQLVAVADCVSALANVVGLKNRFNEPLFNGYRDALFSLQVSKDGTVHVCELQLHLAQIVALKHETHAYYAYFRSYFGGNMEAAHLRMRLLQRVTSGKDGSTFAAFLQGALQSEDDALLEALDELLGEGMLAEFELASAVRRRRVDLAREVRIETPEAASATKLVALELSLALALLQASYFDAARDLAQTVSTDAASAPALRIEAKRVVGVAKRFLGDHAGARSTLETCIAQAQALLGNDALLTLGLCKDFAIHCLAQTGDGEAELRRVAGACARLASQAAVQADDDQAGLLRRVGLDAEMCLANVLVQQGDMAQAAEIYDASYSAYVKCHGPDHPATLRVSGNRALLYRVTGDLQKAEALGRDTLDRMAFKLGGRHRTTHITAGELHHVFMTNGMAKHDADTQVAAIVSAADVGREMIHLARGAGAHAGAPAAAREPPQAAGDVWAEKMRISNLQNAKPHETRLPDAEAPPGAEAPPDAAAREEGI